jgi:hypothetical protein
MKFFTLLALLPVAFSAAVESPISDDSTSCCSNHQHHPAVVKLVRDVTLAAGSKLSRDMDQLVLSLASDEDKKAMSEAAKKNTVPLKSAAKAHPSMDMTDDQDEETPATSRLEKRHFGYYSPYWGGFGGYWGGYGGYGYGGYGGYGWGGYGGYGGYPYYGGWYKKRSLESVDQDESAHLQKRWGMFGASYPYGYPFYGM